MAQRQFDVLDRPEVLEVLFHPRRDAGGLVSGDVIHSVRIPVADEIALGGRLFTAGPEAPAILFFHGNGEIAADYDAIAPLYLRLGITLLVVDFRGYGTSDGHPTAGTMLSDALSVFEKTRLLLSEHDLNPKRLFVMGRSMGSAPALEIAAHAGDAIDGLIIESGFAHTIDLVRRLGMLSLEDADEARDGFGNLEKMASIRVPILILHGLEDWVIPVAEGIALFENAVAEGKNLVTIPDAGHNDILVTGMKPYFQAVYDFCGPWEKEP